MKYRVWPIELKWTSGRQIEAESELEAASFYLNDIDPEDLDPDDLDSDEFIFFVCAYDEQENPHSMIEKLTARKVSAFWTWLDSSDFYDLTPYPDPNLFAKEIDFIKKEMGSPSDH